MSGCKIGVLERENVRINERQYSSLCGQELSLDDGIGGDLSFPYVHIYDCILVNLQSYFL